MGKQNYKRNILALNKGLYAFFNITKLEDISINIIILRHKDFHLYTYNDNRIFSTI